MNPAISIALLLSVLQVSRGQKVTSLTACLVNQNLRLDCRHENTTRDNSIQHEFSLTREKKKHVLSGTLGIPEHTYRSRVTLSNQPYIKVLTLANFTTKDEGEYSCELRVSGANPISSNKSISVYRDKLVKCGGVSLLGQNTSWLLLLLLLSPSLLQALDFISL
ncbi:thy-1 membrane glycoprotein [Mus pahari]|uniref:thy-1 membrane glycoprotein n=1 Tax=Mus pahari TaxID=10093 RepID=UPI000A304E37|nr:thy-1 membrane glycoprotein [Mus pahari]XP_029399296.1 thy-1 membrane glycoprotein [Mus pahari]